MMAEDVSGARRFGFSFLSAAAGYTSAYAVIACGVHPLVVLAVAVAGFVVASVVGTKQMQAAEAEAADREEP